MSEPASGADRSFAGDGLAVRARVAELESSKIREVADLGMDDDGIIPLWFGEGDLPTPDFVIEAAKRGLDAGDTYYTENQGVPRLRETIARYVSSLYGAEVGVERVTVTASGMAAIMIVAQTLIDAGDNVVVVTPIWPNCRETVHIMGGEARAVELNLGDGGWTLDLDRLFGAVDERTRALYINSPSNPTGWMMTAEEQRQVLDFARERGIWVVADEVYDRIVYDRPRAPSFVELAAPDDPVIAINSFSKSWCMTGWRLGWITAPAAMGELFGKLIEYNYCCAPGFAQQAGIAAITQGEPFVAELVDHYRRGRDLVYQRLSGHRRVRLARPEAAFYAFFAVDGMTDSTALAKRIVREHRVGLAPGAAFGPGGEGHLRLCFASAADTLSRALDRLDGALEG